MQIRTALFFLLGLAALTPFSRADFLAKITQEKLPFSTIPELVRSHGGWSLPIDSAQIRFAIPDSRGFVWAGMAHRSSGQPESASSAWIELLAPESGSEAGQAFPQIADELALLLSGPTSTAITHSFQSSTVCRIGSLESQVGSTIKAKGRRPLSLRSTYAPRAVISASVGSRSGFTSEPAFSRAKTLIDALLAGSDAQGLSKNLSNRLKNQLDRSSGHASTCPALSLGSAWPAPLSSLRLDERLAMLVNNAAVFSNFLSQPDWRAEVGTDVTNPLRVELLSTADDAQAQIAHDAARQRFGVPQRARMAFEMNTPEFALTWLFPDGSNASLKYQRRHGDERGSLLFEINPLPER
jgi:hypothetical protein